jgi:UDP-N-acetylglucosamine 2-epimerase (non-hydrolysing)
MTTKKIINVVGARPNFIKIAPIMAEMGKSSHLAPLLVHTGQHYDENVSRLFFEELEIPKPDVNLEVGSSSHARQTAEIMKHFEPVLLAERPDLVLVVGDVNSTIACSLVAVKLGIPVAHVEAGLRSFDRRMPEEINRLLTDAISDLLFVTEESGIKNLRREGIPSEKIHFVGNVMIDTLLRFREKAGRSTILEDLGLKPRSYAAMTLHRPSNVDDKEDVLRIFRAIEEISRDLPVVFPVHPRTRESLTELDLWKKFEGLEGLVLTEPLGYLDFLHLMDRSALMLTDSGGIQEETTVLQVPCITIRENTERPVTVIEGTNIVAGTDPVEIVRAARQALASPPPARLLRHPLPKRPLPKYWDGKAAERIVRILET